MTVRLRVKYGKYEPNTLYTGSNEAQLVAQNIATTDLTGGVAYDADSDKFKDGAKWQTPVSLKLDAEGDKLFADNRELNVGAPIELTAAQIASPSADILQDATATYQLNQAPFTRYKSNGSALELLAGATDAQVLNAVSNAPSVQFGNFARRLDITKTQTQFAAVPFTDPGTLVADRFNAALTYARTSRGVTLEVPGSFQTKAPLYIGNDTKLEGIYGSGFGYSGITPQGDYPAIQSNIFNGGTDCIRSEIRGLLINPTNLHNGNAYAIDFKRQFFTVVEDVSIDPAATGRNAKALRIQDSDSVRFYDFKITQNSGQMFAIGAGSQNINFFGGNFENSPGQATIPNEIDAYNNFGDSFTGAFAVNMQLSMYGTQFERAGTTRVNAAFVSFNDVQFKASPLVLGPRARGVAVLGAKGEDANFFTMSASTVLRQLAFQNASIDGQIHIGANVASAHARHASDPADSVFFPGGVEWFFMSEIFAATQGAITLSGAGERPGNSTNYAVEAGGVQYRDAAGNVLETSTLRDLRRGEALSTTFTGRDTFNYVTLLRSPDTRLTLATTATAGAAGVRPNAWRNRLNNGLLTGTGGSGGTAVPTGWTGQGSPTLAAGSTAGYLSISSAGGASIEQIAPVRAGRTYMAVARVISAGNLSLVVGRANQGGDGRRMVFCQRNASFDPGYGDGSTLLQCFFTVTGRSENAYISLGSIGAINPANEQVKWIALVELGGEGKLWTLGAPTTGVFEVGDEAYEVAPTAGGAFKYICTARGTPGTWKAVNLQA